MTGAAIHGSPDYSVSPAAPGAELGRSTSLTNDTSCQTNCCSIHRTLFSWRILMRIHVLLVLVIIILLMGGHQTISGDEAKDKAIKKTVKAMKGEWQMISRVIDGQEDPKEVVQSRTIKIEPKKYTVWVEGELDTELTYILDPTKKPMLFDVTFQSGDFKGKTRQGIIEIEKDTLTICLAGSFGKGRPVAFKSKQGDGQVLAKYKRVKK
jgi:uncharacterized protein (TIGR03067 family)